MEAGEPQVPQPEVELGRPEEGGAPKNQPQTLKEKFVIVRRYVMLITIISDVAMFVIGCIKANECPLNDQIPLFLIAMGVLGPISKVVTYAVKDRIQRHFDVMHLESALCSAQIVFIIFGSYWVLKVYKPSFDPRDSSNYCDKTAYIFALSVLCGLCLIFFATIVFFACKLAYNWRSNAIRVQEQQRDAENHPRSAREASTQLTETPTG